MSLGDEEHRISLLFEAKEAGEHVHVAVRSGIKGMRALAGSFVLRRDEWTVLRDNLGYSLPVDDKLAASYRYAPSGAPSYLSGVRIVHFDTMPIEVTETRVAERDAELFANLERLSERVDSVGHSHTEPAQ